METRISQNPRQREEEPVECSRQTSRPPPRVDPSFTHEELRQIWNALAQYCDNHDVKDDETSTCPEAAVAALAKLDAWVAGAAG